MPILNTIKKRSKFLKIAKSGKFYRTETLLLQADVKDKPESNSEIGFTITKKTAKTNTNRNFIKRRLKAAAIEVFSKFKNSNYDYVIIGKAKSLNCDFKNIKKDLESALARIK